MFFLQSRKRLFYVVFALISLISSFSVIFFGIEQIENTELYNIHLQSLAVLSIAGLIDYFYVNRMERSAVKHYTLINKILSQNLLFIVIPFVLTIIFWGSVYAFFLNIVLIRHFINLRRSVELINSRFNLSYITYFGQISRNIIVFIPSIAQDSYLLFFLCTFLPELIYIVLNRAKGAKQKWRLSFKVKLVRANSFLYRLFYVGTDTIVRVIFPFYLVAAEAANYLYVVNMMLLPVAGYSLVGGIVHSHILRTKKSPDLKAVLAFITTATLALFIFYFLINLHDNIIVLMALSLAASLKFVDQILISSKVSLGYFAHLKTVFLAGFLFSLAFLIITIHWQLEPIFLMITATGISSLFLMWFSFRRGRL